MPDEDFLEKLKMAKELANLHHPDDPDRRLEAEIGLRKLPNKDLQQQLTKFKDDRRNFNLPEHQADFGFWAKNASWSAQEAVLLLLGRDPRHVNSKQIRSSKNISEFASAYSDTMQISLRAISGGQLGPIAYAPLGSLEHHTTSPKRWIGWAKDINIEVPTKLERAVLALAGDGGLGWKTRAETADKELKVLRSKYEKLETQLSETQTKLKSLEDNPFEFDEEDPAYSYCLAVAVHAWDYARKNLLNARNSKAQILAWLKDIDGLSNNQCEHIASVVNFNKKGGAPSK